VSPRHRRRSPAAHLAFRLRRTAALIGAAATTAALLSAGSASGAVGRVELPIASSSPQTDVVSSVVRLHVPLPADSPAHPEACDWISYERFRSVDGPTDPTQADAVAVLMPGLIEGATAFDPVARNTIREEARRGRHVEVWAIDRRSNCLEDHRGIDAAEQTGDPQTMVDYYYGHKPIDGHVFTGFKVRDRILAEFGVARTIEDYNAVLVDELPSQPWRESHVICGGHSLGGPLTELYASWDFDGNKATTQDAGYRQCAGFMGFDTELKGELSNAKRPSTNKLMNALSGGLLSGAHDITLGALRSRTIPRSVDLSGIGPETMGLLEAVGLLADRTPNDDWSAMLAQIPHSSTTDQFFHISGAASMDRWLLSKDSMRDFRYSYQAAVGQIMDDNGAVFGLVRSSFGYFDGAPVRLNRLPGALAKVPLIGQFAQAGSLVLPQRVKTNPLIGWRNYDQLGTGTAQLGQGITTPGAEVTDAPTFDRILHEGPLNLTENYFPIRILADWFLIGGGDRSREFKAILHPQGVTEKPRFVVIAGDGVRAHDTTFSDPYVRLPGYQHLDVLTAAEHQNDGKPEGSSQAFANLIDQSVVK
jgi:hypothetical protein